MVPQKKPYVHTILDCFVECGFATESHEIAMLIYHIFSTEKNTPSYTNKYDEITLYEHYKLVSFANEFPLTYENFMEKLFASKNIVWECPVEILMRILSRLYNVIITFYSERLTKIVINNCLDNGVKNINIYQYYIDSFFTIIPIVPTNGEKDVPLLFAPNNDTYYQYQQPISKPINDITDILDI